MFSFRNTIFTFRSIVQFELIFMYCMRYEVEVKIFFFSPYGQLFAPAQYEKTTFPPPHPVCAGVSRYIRQKASCPSWVEQFLDSPLHSLGVFVYPHATITLSLLV